MDYNYELENKEGLLKGNPFNRNLTIVEVEELC